MRFEQLAWLANWLLRSPKELGTAADMADVTATFRNFVVSVLALIVMSPSLMTIFDVGPMGYHDGLDLLVRVGATLVASMSLAAVCGIAAYLYWVHVIEPGQRTAQVVRSR